jgi:hypothetical protein
MSSLHPLYLPRLRPSLRPAADRGGEVPPVYDKAPQRQAPDIPTADAKAIAARIIEAGRVRRGEVSEGGAGLTHPLARAIVAAAAKARSTAPTAPELPEHPLARAIVLSGQKALGTIDAAGALWLADYFGKIEATRGLLR